MMNYIRNVWCTVCAAPWGQKLSALRWVIGHEWGHYKWTRSMKRAYFNVFDEHDHTSPDVSQSVYQELLKRPVAQQHVVTWFNELPDTDPTYVCPKCGCDECLYGRADIRWQPFTKSWEPGDIEDTLDCTHCDWTGSMSEAERPAS